MGRCAGEGRCAASGSRTVDTDVAAEHSDQDVLREVQADQAQQRTEPKQPDVERHAGDDPEHRRHTHLQPGSFHSVIMGRRHRAGKTAHRSAGRLHVEKTLGHVPDRRNP